MIEAIIYSKLFAILNSFNNIGTIVSLFLCTVISADAIQSTSCCCGKEHSGTNPTNQSLTSWIQVKNVHLDEASPTRSRQRYRCCPAVR